MVEWFYGKEGQQYGPIDEATLRARISTAAVGPQDLIWREGMAAWTPLSQLSQFGVGSMAPSSPSQEGSGEVDPNAPPPSNSPYAPPVANLTGAYQPGPAMAVTNGLAIASMVCGILSLVFFCFCGGIFFGVPAVICGHLGLNQLNNPENKQQGRGMAIAGLICGYIGVAIFAVMILSGQVRNSF
ncbi:MAG: hypothetical protein ACJAQT_003918 [Akkermansiaceae bacterium]|jgi:hypothetical protein